MVIDFHAHVFAKGWVPNRFFEGIATLAAASMQKKGMDACATDITKMMADSDGDPHGDELIKEMDGAGIDKTIVLPIDYGIGLGEPDITVEELNHNYRDMAARHKDRLIWFAGIDPRREHAAELLKQLIAEGARGLKLQQACGFYPTSKDTYRLMQILVDHDLPVLFHCSHMIPPFKSKYCEPRYIDELSIDFPNLKIIAGHLGTAMAYRDWIPILKTRNNVFGDISLWQEEAKRDYDQFCRSVRDLLDHVGYEKVLFGSDTPASRGQMSVADWVKLWQTLPEKAGGGVEFSQKEIDGIMSGSARAAFGY
ncbi:MAG: amidohydrolase family protein [Gammaproteobacteria bacterium]|nr:amidohydrolase family protein [Gammaproteobacteria bacterium]